jgi:hypothetical protein
VIAFPDIVFTAEDIGRVGGIPITAARTDTSNWVNNDAINGQDVQVDGGPGVIQGPVFIRFSSLLPYFVNQTPFFLGGGGLGGGGLYGYGDESTAFQSFVWGSFDGSTDAPIIYPAYGTLTLQDLRRYIVGGN